jgi:hypothetical protein
MKDSAKTPLHVIRDKGSMGDGASGAVFHE